MMEKDDLNSLASLIKGETFLGTEELQKCNIEEAIDHFDAAYKVACKTEDDQVKRACAFNLGAAHIANHDPVKGIAFLKKAITPNQTDTCLTNGDLYYNFGLAYELLGGESEATKYFELALEEYQKCGDLQMSAEVAMRIGVLYLSQNEMLQAARVFGIAATSYAGLSDSTNQALSLSKQAAAMVKTGRLTDALRLADDCMLVCQKSEQTEELGKIYNELGLIYTKCEDYIQAQKCFELALPLSRTAEGNSRQEAFILQNLGATYNSLGEYQRALSFHESAIAMHAKLNNRKTQGQCFLNLAYAYSRLGDIESAGECYLHALQAAKDTDDLHSQWQALEGLGAIYTHMCNYHRAIKYYQQAISTFTKSEENNPVAQNRLMAKLNDALERNLPMSSPQQNVVSKASAISPLEERVTRQQVNQYSEVRKNALTGKKIPYEFERIAMGLGEYDIDSDFAIPDKRRQFASKLDEVDQNWRQSVHSKRRHKYKDENGSTSFSSGQDICIMNEKKQATQKRLSRRQSSRRKIEERGCRPSHLNPILKPEEDDTEEENRRNESNNTKQNTDVGEQKLPAVIKRERIRELLAPVQVHRQDGSPELDTGDAGGEESKSSGKETESMNEASISNGADKEKHDKVSLDPEERPSASSTNNSEAEIQSYYRKIEQLAQQESAHQSEQSDDDPGSEVEGESDLELTDTLGAPDYTAPYPSGKQPPLHQTYIKPVDALDPSNNRVKVSVPDEEDPTYQRISSLIPDVTPQPTLKSRDSQPALPYIPISHLSTAEHEALLREYHQHHSQNTRSQVGRPQDDIPLPQRINNKAKSKACVLM